MSLELDLVTQKRLCELLHVSRGTVQKLRENNGLPYVKVGKNYRYRLTHIINWFNKNSNNGPEDGQKAVPNGK